MKHSAFKKFRRFRRDSESEGEDVLTDETMKLNTSTIRSGLNKSVMLSKPSSPKNTDEPQQQRRTIDLGSFIRQTAHTAQMWKEDGPFEEERMLHLKNYKGVLKRVHVDINTKYVKIKPMKLYMPNSRLLSGATSIPSLECTIPGSSVANVVLSTESKP